MQAKNIPMGSTCGTVKLHVGGPHAWVYWLSVGKVESLDSFYAVLRMCRLIFAEWKLMGRNRAGADGVGSIHAVDVHPSRKHLCVVSFYFRVHFPTFYLFGQVNWVYSLSSYAVVLSSLW